MKYFTLFFQLLLARGLSSPPDLLRGDEDFCGSTTATQDPHKSKDVVVNGCQSPVGDTPRKDLLKWTLFQHRPATGVCISEATLNWHKYCSHYQDINIRTVLQREGKCVEGCVQDNYLSDCGCGDSTPSLSVDYLFLIEHSCRTDKSSVETLLSTIRSVVDYTSDRTVFHNVWVQLGFIVYVRHENKTEVTYARDFSPFFPTDVFSHLSVPDEGENCAAETTTAHGYRSVASAVRMIGRALRLVSIESKFYWRVTFANKRSLHLWHRPYSDLHIVSVADVGVAYNKTRGDEEKRREREKDTKRRIMKLPEKIASTVSHPISFHVFFSSSNSVAKSLLGPVHHSVRYADCSHFRKAATLKALIDANHKDSLQAHLLSKGVEFQVHSLRDLRNPQCLLNISPSLSTPQGICPTFPDKCKIQDFGVENQAKYCSSLHGWTERETMASKSDSFQDRVPLSSNFSSSHADIAKSAVQSSGEGRGVVLVRELSVSKVVEGCCTLPPPRPLIVGQPREARWKHDKPFIQEMIKSKEPVVLKGTVVETWGALKKWNMSYLAQNMDTDILSLVKCTNHFLTFDPDHRAPLKVNISLPYTLSNMSTSDFFECVQSIRTCSDGFRGYYYFGAVPSTLKKDVMPDDLLYNTEKDRTASKQFMWVSSAGMITHTHFDQDYNIFVQLVGRKRFTLWSPHQHELMYVYPRVHPMWHKSRVNFGSVDRARFPAFTRARGVQVELGPGDMLYVPPYTWHYVETLSPSVSLSTWSHDYQLYDHMNAIYRHDHKFDLLQNQRGVENTSIHFNMDP